MFSNKKICFETETSLELMGIISWLKYSLLDREENSRFHFLRLNLDMHKHKQLRLLKELDRSDSVTPCESGGHPKSSII